MFFLKRQERDLIDHWYALVDDFQTSPNEFYDSIVQTITAKKIPGLTIDRVPFREGGLLSQQRDYLRFTRERLVFDVCASPFGTGFFFSCRFAESPIRINPVAIFAVVAAGIFALNLLLRSFGFFWGLFAYFGVTVWGIWMLRNSVALGFTDFDNSLINTPWLGPIYERFIRRETYYRTDTRLMYAQTIPAVVKRLATELTCVNGVRLLREFDRPGVNMSIEKPLDAPMHVEVTNYDAFLRAKAE